METKQTNAKVGFITVVGFVVLIFLFTWKSGSLIKFSGYKVVGEFQNVSGLLETADVRYRGYNVGKVMQITPGPESIKVYIKVRNSVQIPVDSKFRIAFDGLIGQKFLEVVPGSSKSMVADGGSINGITAAGIVDFIDEGAKSMQEVQKVLIMVRQFLDTQELQQHLANSAKNIDEATAELKGFGPKMNKVLNDLSSLVANLNSLVDEENQTNVKSTVANLKDSTARLDGIMTELSKLTETPETRENIEKIIRNVREITDQLNGTGNSTNKPISETLQSIKRLSEIEVGVNADLLGNPEHKLATGRAGVDLNLGKHNAFHFKLKEDLDTKQISRVTITGEKPISNKMSYHFGIVDSQLGAGVNYDFSERIRILAEVYQPSEMKANVQAEYALNDNWHVMSAAERIHKNDADVLIGVGFRK